MLAVGSIFPHHVQWIIPYQQTSWAATAIHCQPLPFVTHCGLIHAIIENNQSQCWIFCL